MTDRRPAEVQHSNPIQIFLHIPRTGGTTLSGVLKWEFRRDFDRVILRAPDETIEQFQSRLAQTIPPPLVVIGHFPFGIHEHLARESIYFTILRHPVARVLSEYRWIIRDRLHPLHERFEGREQDGLAEYGSSNDTSRYVENVQVRYAAGVPWSADVARRDLDTAKKSIERQFAVAGTTERFDETFLLMRRLLGWRTPVWVTRNESAAETRRISASTEVVDAIRERNELDLELYQFVARGLDTAIERQGESFQRELAVFRAVHKPVNAIGRRAQGLLSAYARFRLAHNMQARGSE
jgi:Galactose-3-O-sulfotransferase